MVYREGLSMTLPKLLDLALGSPEVGAVNFHILHTLLHIILQQLELTSAKAEFIGQDADKMERMLLKGPKESPVKLEEYVVSKEDTRPGISARIGTKCVRRQPDVLNETVVVVMPPSLTPPEHPRAEDMVVTETRLQLLYERGAGGPRKRPTAVRPAEVSGPRGVAGAPPGTVPGHPVAPRPVPGHPGQVVPGAPGVSGVPVTPYKMDFVSGSQKVLGVRPGEVVPRAHRRPVPAGRRPKEDIPATGASPGEESREVLPAATEPKTILRGRHPGDEVPDSPAQEAVAPGGRPGEVAPEDDESVGGLRAVALVGGAGFGATAAESASEGGPVEERLDIVEGDLRSVWQALEHMGPTAAEEMCDELQNGLLTLERRLKEVEKRVGAIEKRPSRTSTSSASRFSHDAPRDAPGRPWEGPFNALQREFDRLREATQQSGHEEAVAALDGQVPLALLCKCATDMKNVKRCLNILAGGEYELFEKGGNIQLVDINRIRKAELKMDDITQEQKRHERLLEGVTQQIETIQEQTNDTEREIGLLAERACAGTPGSDSSPINDSVGLKELFNKIHLIQCDMEVMSNTCSKLMEERDLRTEQLQELAKQLETLRRMKADREEVHEALISKADQRMVSKKVSHEQFDTAMEDLAKGLQEAVEKLSQQEHLWQQALDEIQNEIANKLDSKELSPLKDFINKKLKMLQERLRNLAKVRKQAEAAGTKKKLFKDVTCISCDVDAVMRREVDANVPIPPPMFPNRSMKPFLTYELDMIRKEQNTFSAKHMILLEQAMATNIKEERTEEETVVISKGDHLCNRYCGGGHTLTTAHQRVTRMGHFMVPDAGPVCLPMVPGKQRSPADICVGRHGNGDGRKGEASSRAKSDNENKK